MAGRIATGGMVAAVLAAVVGCAQFPELDAAERDSTPSAYPRIVPVEPILARATDRRAAPDMADTLEARAEALRRKAAALRARSF